MSTHIRRVMHIVVMTAVVAIAVIMHIEGRVMAEGSLAERVKVIGEYRQDEVELMIENFIAQLYNATSSSDAENAANELKEIMTSDEIDNIKDEIGYNYNGYRVQEIMIHYISEENSSDGRAREMIDLKVGNDSVNCMYMIECKINGEGKIFSHTIWRY